MHEVEGVGISGIDLWGGGFVAATSWFDRLTMRSTKVERDRSLIDLILSSSKDEVAGT